MHTCSSSIDLTMWASLFVVAVFKLFVQNHAPNMEVFPSSFRKLFKKAMLPRTLMVGMKYCRYMVCFSLTWILYVYFIYQLADHELLKHVLLITLHLDVYFKHDNPFVGWWWVSAALYGTCLINHTTPPANLETSIKPFLPGSGSEYWRCQGPCGWEMLLCVFSFYGCPFRLKEILPLGSWVPVFVPIVISITNMDSFMRGWSDKKYVSVQNNKTITHHGTRWVSFVGISVFCFVMSQ